MKIGLVDVDGKGNGFPNLALMKEKETNLLYREFGVRVRGKQNFETGEIDRNDLQLVDLIDYTPKYDDLYINSLISKVGDKFKEIDVDAWIAEIRGNNE